MPAGMAYNKKSIRSSSLKPVLLASFNAIRTPIRTPADISTPYHITSIPNIVKATGFIFSPFYFILFYVFSAVNTIVIQQVWDDTTPVPLSPEDGLEFLGQDLKDFFVDLFHLLFFHGAVLVSVGNGEGGTLISFLDVFTFIHIKQLNTFNQIGNWKSLKRQ
jgi:hypothetical protein